MPRGDLTKAPWARLQPLLPPQTPPTGRLAVDHRRMLNGMLEILRTGAPRQAEATGQLDGAGQFLDRPILRARPHAAGATKGLLRPPRSAGAKGARHERPPAR